MGLVVDRDEFAIDLVVVVVACEESSDLFVFESSSALDLSVETSLSQSGERSREERRSSGSRRSFVAIRIALKVLKKLFVFVALASKDGGFDRKPQACTVDAVACEVGMKTCFARSCSVFACVFVLLGLVRRRTRDKISLLLAGNSWGERFLACARTFTLREGLEGSFKVSAT